jgi:hypothetical protein
MSSNALFCCVIEFGYEHIYMSTMNLLSHYVVLFFLFIVYLNEICCNLSNPVVLNIAGVSDSLNYTGDIFPNADIAIEEASFYFPAFGTFKGWDIWINKINEYGGVDLTTQSACFWGLSEPNIFTYSMYL